MPINLLNSKSKLNETWILCPFLSPHLGGVETHLSDLIAVLQKQNRKAVVFSFHPGKQHAGLAHREVRGSVTIYRSRFFSATRFNGLEKFPLLLFLYFTFGLLAMIFPYALFHFRRPGLIHAHGLNAAMAARIFNFFFRSDFLVQTHAIYDFAGGFFSSVVRFTLSKAKAVLCLSNASMEEIKKLGVPASKIFRYSYWIDLSHFRVSEKTSEFKSQLGIDTTKIVLLFVGRLLAIKGILQLIEIVEKLPGSDFVLLIAGGGPIEAEVKRRSEHLSQVLFLGPKKNEDLLPLYQVADLLIVPSLYAEGFGRVIAEALACGADVLGTQMGGIPEALGYGEVGHLCQTEKAPMQQQLENILNNKKALSLQEKQTLKNKLRSFAEKKFGEQNAEAILKYYPKAL